MEEEIVSRVKQSGLIQLDLEEMRIPGERIFLDIKPQLFMELVLKEKDFRNYLAEHDWASYQDKHVAVGCSNDAIIPTWAFMLISIHLSPFAKTIVFGTLEDLEKTLFKQSIDELSTEDLQGARVVIKGCSKESVPTDAYVQIAQKLQPLVKSLFFGEPCSTVPLFKKKS
ncbi:DUF2480 family protein [Aquirufa aurantiipilula]|uniref:DUF2480 family protein n=1 Tax=Aquirufa aurantiipilula TaxID=2696561 RepID=A0ABT6BMY4_9BACT|nr:DUF2480 family protein [Aquirufa aurantiipilula]MDF5691807.1 DUF2480 family protein [Aquirufa aurantiipilula]